MYKIYFLIIKLFSLYLLIYNQFFIHYNPSYDEISPYHYKIIGKNFTAINNTIRNVDFFVQYMGEYWKRDQINEKTDFLA
jgi:hypothetical protein